MAPCVAYMQDTGMDLQQLDNWVINARVRLWRPMVCSVFSQFFGQWIADAQVCSVWCALHVWDRGLSR